MSKQKKQYALMISITMMIEPYAIDAAIKKIFRKFEKYDPIITDIIATDKKEWARMKLNGFSAGDGPDA